ncbi:class GN sortase [Aquimonas voraii]|uniref:Sortase A n=1 Tax=Aquimonas voraii TaxID=265719 RepID=A0A1G6YBM8_9GAMM|nr:class GN sortase [Aquimonas voraii]SDD87403.1 sortase A [Aquimonas voraii]
MQSPTAARMAKPAPLSLRRRWLALSLLLASGVLLLQALWIPAKAELAQWLLARSWSAARATGVAQPPWAWADTRAVALLRRAGEDTGQIVLAGDSGRVLAFGPGWNPASAAPGGQGTVVISAHRDTHFAWLRDLGEGATLELEGLGGMRRYRLRERHILDVRKHALAPDAGEDQLLLVTCWPFDAEEAGGPLRLVLRFLPLERQALALSPAAAPPSPPRTPASPRSADAGTGSSHRG